LPIVLPRGQAKTSSVSLAAFLVPVLDTKKPLKQQCRIEGTMPYEDNKQVAITLVIGGQEYRGTLGTRSDVGFLYIATRLWDKDGKEHKIAYLLRDNNFKRNQRIPFTVSGKRIVLH
jgi:hypothetical protein